jgi:hypothetical protein
MFEIGIIGIIVLAVGYWVTLWLMGRHDDVLHGDFVHTEQGAETPPPPAPSLPVKPPFPARPPAAKPSEVKPSRIKPAAVKSAPAETLSVSAAPSSPPADRSDTLQALLTSIKRDLKDASQL